MKTRASKIVARKRAHLFAVALMLTTSLVALTACSNSAGESENNVNSWIDPSHPEPDAADVEPAEDVVCGDPDERLSQPYQMVVLEGCDVFRGTLDFAYKVDMIDLTHVPSLKVIEGTLNLFHNDNLESLKGLERLERVGKLILRSSEVLDDLTALSNIREVDRLSIIFNKSLTTLEGLENLQVVGDLSIYGNPELRSLDGLDGLELIRGDLKIESSSVLSRETIDAFLQRVQVEGEVVVSSF
jgi:hypothetical protein